MTSDDITRLRTHKISLRDEETYKQISSGVPLIVRGRRYREDEDGYVVGPKIGDTVIFRPLFKPWPYLYKRINHVERSNGYYYYTVNNYHLEIKEYIKKISKLDEIAATQLKQYLEMVPSDISMDHLETRGEKE